MRYNYIRGATKAEDGYDRPACYQVFRDEYRRGLDFSAWYIREDEVRPLHELLGSLLAAASPTQPGQAELEAQGEALARRFHELYEELAPQHGYETRKESAVPWDDVPAQNKALMTHVAMRIIEEGR
jgi:hypothetical protein